MAFKSITVDTVYLLTSPKTPLNQLHQDIEILQGKGYNVYYFEEGFDDRLSMDMRQKRFDLRAAARELERIAISADKVYVAVDDSTPFMNAIQMACRSFNVPIIDLYNDGR